MVLASETFAGLLLVVVSVWVWVPSFVVSLPFSVPLATGPLEVKSLLTALAAFSIVSGFRN